MSKYSYKNGTLKFGKYTAIKPGVGPVHHHTYADAVAHKILSTPTQKNLNQLTDVGCNFTDVYIVDKPHCSDKIIIGTDPNKKEILYFRRGTPPGTMGQSTYVYYEDRKVLARDAYHTFSANSKPKNLSITDILNKIVKGKYTITNGVCDVKGSVTISNIPLGFTYHEMTDIPIKFGEVSGNFTIQLGVTSIKNCPDSVGGSFQAIGKYPNKLSSEGFPTFLGGSIYIDKIILDNLTAFPRFVDGNLSLMDTDTSTFVGGPTKVDGEIVLSHQEKLTSLKSIPQSKRIEIHSIPNLTSLKGIEDYTYDSAVFTHLGINSTDYLPNAQILKLYACYELSTINIEKYYSMLDIHACSNLRYLNIKRVGTVQIRECNNLNSLDGIELIEGDLMIHACNNITERTLLLAGIGDKVMGKLFISYKELDKTKFSKAYKQALSDNEHGIDLTF